MLFALRRFSLMFRFVVCSLFISVFACCLLFVVCCSLFDVRCSLFVVC